MRNVTHPIQTLIRSGLSAEDIHNYPGLYMNTYTTSRLLFLHELYRMILPVHGSIMEFGVRFGQDLAWWANLRSIYEPFNFRPIIGFDSWQGFLDVSPKDGNHAVGELTVPEKYEQSLASVMDWHEAQIYPDGKFYALVKGDARQTVSQYLAEQPQTIVALAYFDIDLYEPTKACLEAILPHLTRGSVLAFDELDYADWPGETVALREVLGLGRLALKRTPQSRSMSYCVVE